MTVLNTEEAAVRLGVSARRVQQLVKTGRLPAKEFGGSYMIEEKDLKLVEDRPQGRPPKPKPGQSNGRKRGAKK